MPRLWTHQTEGIEAVRRGRDVLVTTPTASGKSLVFQIPPREEAVRVGPGHGLFLFTLKALGQDQRGKLLKLAAEARLPPEVAGCGIYDGDTPAAKRTAIRKEFPRVVISNPDMLHLGILGHWTGWGPFLADLRAGSCSTSCTPTAAPSAATSTTSSSASSASAARWGPIPS